MIESTRGSRPWERTRSASIRIARMLLRITIYPDCQVKNVNTVIAFEAAPLAPDGWTLALAPGSGARGRRGVVRPSPGARLTNGAGRAVAGAAPAPRRSAAR